MVSGLEQRIINILNMAGIEWQKEYQITDLRSGRMRFDFFLPKENKILEVNGEQHYKFVKKFFSTKSDFLKAQERDRIKISYALAHGIDMYIYPFFELPKSKDQLFDKKYKATSKFHNDIVWSTYKKKQEGK